MKMSRMMQLLGVLALLVAPAAVQAEERPRFAPDAEIRDAFDEVVAEARASVAFVLTSTCVSSPTLLQLVLPRGTRVQRRFVVSLLPRSTSTAGTDSLGVAEKLKLGVRCLGNHD